MTMARQLHLTGRRTVTLNQRSELVVLGFIEKTIMMPLQEQRHDFRGRITLDTGWVWKNDLGNFERQGLSENGP